jgi:hypothetical protein
MGARSFLERGLGGGGGVLNAVIQFARATYRSRYQLIGYGKLEVPALSCVQLGLSSSFIVVGILSLKTVLSFLERGGGGINAVIYFSRAKPTEALVI